MAAAAPDLPGHALPFKIIKRLQPGKPVKPRKATPHPSSAFKPMSPILPRLTARSFFTNLQGAL